MLSRSPTAANLSRTRLVYATPKLARCISPMCAIRMATSSAPCIAFLPDAGDRDKGRSNGYGHAGSNGPCRKSFTKRGRTHFGLGQHRRHRFRQQCVSS